MAQQSPDTTQVPDELQSNVLLTTVDFIYNLGRSFSLWPMTFGLACCAIEFIVAGSARYDLSRFGMEVIRPSPRQCDLLIVSGTVTKKMVVPIVRLYNQMSEPRYVVSMGACATGGGPFKEGYNVVSGIDKFLPVDVYVPGCPPTPEALLNGFISLQKKVRSQSVRTVPWYRKEYTGEIAIPVLGPDIFGTDPAELKRVRDVSLQRLMTHRATGKSTIVGVKRAGSVEQVFIENSGMAQELSGWKLVSGDGLETFEFPAGFVLMPNSDLRILSGPGAVASAANDLVWKTDAVWPPEQGSATLLDADGNKVSTLSY